MKGLAAAGDITGGIHGEHALMGDMLASAAVSRTKSRREHLR